MLRVFMVMAEPFGDRSTQEPPILRTIAQYGYEHIAKQTLAYLKEPFVDALGHGPCSSLGCLGVLVRCFAQIDEPMGQAFLEYGVYSALIQRAWKVIRKRISDEETFEAFHESIASTS